MNWQASPCILSKGRLSSQGYAIFWISKHKGIRAHRLSYELFVGPIPEGLVIDHLCRNRACINVAHLEPVLPGTNTLRGNAVSGINSRKTHCDAGHPFTSENTYLRSTGHRTCRICNNKRTLAYYHKIKKLKRINGSDKT